MRHQTHAAAAVLALCLLAACGRGENQSAGGEVGRDTTSADSTVLGPPVGTPEVKDAFSDTLAAVKGRQDVAREKGMTAAEGIDSAAAGGVRAAANDTGVQIPGQTRLRQRNAPNTTGPSGTKRP
jgi:hypothetical protein